MARYAGVGDRGRERCHGHAPPDQASSRAALVDLARADGGRAQQLQGTRRHELLRATRGDRQDPQGPAARPARRTPLTPVSFVPHERPNPFSERPVLATVIIALLAIPLLAVVLFATREPGRDAGGTDRAGVRGRAAVSDRAGAARPRRGRFARGGLSPQLEPAADDDEGRRRDLLRELRPLRVDVAAPAAVRPQPRRRDRDPAAGPRLDRAGLRHVDRGDDDDALRELRRAVRDRLAVRRRPQAAAADRLGADDHGRGRPRSSRSGATSPARPSSRRCPRRTRATSRSSSRRRCRSRSGCSGTHRAGGCPSSPRSA